MKRLRVLMVLLPCLAAGTAFAKCEIHPDYTAAFRAELNNVLYEVRSQEQLASIIYRLIIIDKEVIAHELAHFNAAQGWAEQPVYSSLELYGETYRFGGCVAPKPGIPLEIAHRAALAPKRPSPHDIAVAREIVRRMQMNRRR